MVQPDTIRVDQNDSKLLALFGREITRTHTPPGGRPPIGSCALWSHLKRFDHRGSERHAPDTMQALEVCMAGA
jgi:hypothetical protein